jgi:hypothetical protein
MLARRFVLCQGAEQPSTSGRFLMAALQETK